MFMQCAMPELGEYGIGLRIPGHLAVGAFLVE